MTIQIWATQIPTILIVNKIFKRIIISIRNISINYLNLTKIRYTYVDLIFIYKLLFSFCKISNIFQSILILLKITMLFTLFKSYLNNYLKFFKNKKWIVDIYMRYICIFNFKKIYITFLFVAWSIVF